MRHYIEVRRFRLEEHWVKCGERAAMECVLEDFANWGSSRDATNATAFAATAFSGD